MKLDSNHSSGPVRDGCNTVLLWNCTPNRNWASEFEDVLSSDLKFHLTVRRIGECSQCCEAKFLRGAVALILTAAEDEQSPLLGVLDELHRHCFRLPILAITDAQDQLLLMNWIDEGVSDFIGVPIRPWEVLARLKPWVLNMSSKADVVANELAMRASFEGIVGRSEAIRGQIEKVRRYATCDSTVLILGETGTGKEVFARAIHYASRRASFPFVPVNCAALPVDLIENELFGHESGAYTGASRPYSGLIEQAAKGTLFLDEIDSLPLSAQAKLLRFLQEHEYRPLGAGRSRHADVRVISASNNNLQEAIKKGRFREDLFFRLNVLSVALPPLRLRRDDIPLLAEHLLGRHERKATSRKTFSRGALHKLMNHSWPGNVRELENVIERAMVLSVGNIIEEADIDLPVAASDMEDDSFKAQKARAVYEFEHRFLEDALVRNGGNISAAARSVAKDRRAFFHLIRKHNLTNRNPGTCQTSSLPAGPMGM